VGRIVSFGCAALLAACAARVGVPEVVDAADIPHYRALAPGLAVGGQPSPAALTRLGEMGFRTVINLRTADEGAEEEGEVVRTAGLRYVWVPVTAASLSLEDVRRVEEVLDDVSSGPVLLHCASSNRVGGVWAAIQARNGKSLEEAEKAGEEAGLRSPAVRDAVRRLLEDDTEAEAP
jgi:uncharacterized protein (TIGR01244 family)